MKRKLSLGMALVGSPQLLILDEPPQLAKRDKGLFKANYEAIKEIGSHLIERNVKLAVFDPLLACNIFLIRS